MSLDESSVIGRISKQWTGFEAEAFTDADNFGLRFPIDLDVKIKAVILGACFLIVSNWYGGRELNAHAANAHNTTKKETSCK